MCIRDRTKGKLKVTTELQVFGLVVTAEPYYAVTQPSDLIVMEMCIRDSAEGWQSTNMIGLSVCAAMSRTIASVKLPPTVDAAINIVGFTRLTTSARLTPFPFPSCFQARLSAAGRAYAA